MHGMGKIYHIASEILERSQMDESLDQKILGMR